MTSDMSDLLHISWPHLPDQCVGYLGRDHAGERKHHPLFNPRKRRCTPRLPHARCSSVPPNRRLTSSKGQLVVYRQRQASPTLLFCRMTMNVILSLDSMGSGRKRSQHN
uniref:Uncharacterized protein n=1 Tax=Oryza meridionalis TaxID=40149 RepID=A0A0E0EXX0_9ORYZ